MKPSISFLIAISLCLGLSGAAHALPLDGLLAYYPFLGNANDMSGNGHNGVVHGATLTSIRERMSDLGGSLEIESEPGKGCKAILTIPVPVAS